MQESQEEKDGVSSAASEVYKGQTELCGVVAVGPESFRAQVPLCFEVFEERVHRICTHFHPKGRRSPVGILRRPKKNGKKNWELNQNGPVTTGG